ncbi:MAG: MFS transporter [Sphingomonas sp.]
MRWSRPRSLPRNRGLAQGVAQNFGSNLLGSFVAPVLLVSFASAFGWREAFYLAGIPGLVSAALIWFLIKEPASPPVSAAEKARKEPALAVLKVRNVWLCCALASSWSPIW